MYDRSSAPPALTHLLIGASNVALGLPWLVAAIRRQCGVRQPARIAGICGHGRSYGVDSSVLGRQLCGIRDSNLWRLLERVERAASSGETEETRARLATLVADVGNDIMYGIPIETIFAWVDEVFDRLHAVDARIVVTGLPLARLRVLDERQYEWARRLLFPQRDLRFRDVMAAAEAVESGLRATCARLGIVFEPLPEELYGRDPIHIRRDARGEFWRRVTAHWCAGEPPTAAMPSLFDRFRLAIAPADRWTRFGSRREHQQPCRRWRDGTALFLY